MLQRLLLITLTLCSLSASAQWQQTGSKVRYVNGLGIPTKDTAAGVAADSSQILIRPADSALYIKYKRTWIKVGDGTVSGTINRVPKFTGATTLGNSSIVDSASSVAMTINPSGNIGINNTAPTYKLDITANSGDQLRLNTPSGQRFTQLYFANNLTSKASLWLDNTDSFFEVYGYSSIGIKLSTNAIERMRITSGGNALINTTTDNGVDKLQVSGSALVTEAFKAATTSGNVSLRTTATTYPVNMTLGANSGMAFHQDGTTSTILATNQNLTSTADLQFQATKYLFSNIGRVIIATSSDNGVDELQVNGSISGIGMKQGYVTKTGAYTATDADYVIDCTSGTFTVTLPASSGKTGRILIIKNSGAGTITVDGNASETIDGASTYSIAVQYGTIQIMSDGTNWKIIAKF